MLKIKKRKRNKTEESMNGDKNIILAMFELN